MGKSLAMQGFFLLNTPRGTGYEGGLRVSMYQTHILKKWIEGHSSAGGR